MVVVALLMHVVVKSLFVFELHLSQTTSITATRACGSLRGKRRVEIQYATAVQRAETMIQKFLTLT